MISTSGRDATSSLCARPRLGRLRQPRAETAQVPEEFGGAAVCGGIYAEPGEASEGNGLRGRGPPVSCAWIDHAPTTIDNGVDWFSVGWMVDRSERHWAVVERRPSDEEA